MPTVREFGLPLIFLVSFAACSGTPTDEGGGGGGETGSIRVTVTTTGDDLDAGYTVTAAGSSQSVSANGSVTFSGVAAGSRDVELGDVAPNCTVSGSATRTVTVTAGETAEVEYQVTCEADVGSVLADAIQALEDALFVAANVESVDDLDGFSFEDAHDLFVQALSESPSNDTAAFGVAVTTVFVLEDDPDVRAMAEDWETWLEEDEFPLLVETLVGPAASIAAWEPATLPLDLSAGDLARVARSGIVASQIPAASALSHAPPPPLAAHQTVLSDVVRPALAMALEALREIMDSGFEFTVTERMQGEEPDTGDPLQLDYTEVLLLQAGLEAALASVEVATAYVLEPNPLDPQGFVDALNPGSDFLTLAPGGADGLADALERLESGADLLLAALDELESETDDQTDDIIKYDPTGTGSGQTPEDIQEARDLIEDLDAALAGPSSVTVDDEYTFTLDAREFFVDPITDLKTVLPDYEVFTAMEGSEEVAVFRWTALNLDDWVVPDPTFSGILPEMVTTQDLIDELAFDEVFFEVSLASGFYQLITVDGLDCRQDYNSGGQGCPVDGEYYRNGYIDLGHRVFLDLFGTEPVDADGSYVVTDEGGGTYSVAMDMQDVNTSMSLMLTGTLEDVPGYTSVDALGRTRGGSTITVSYLGSEWVFEKQF